MGEHKQNPTALLADTIPSTGTIRPGAALQAVKRPKPHIWIVPEASFIREEGGKREVKDPEGNWMPLPEHITKVVVAGERLPAEEWDMAIVIVFQAADPSLRDNRGNIAGLQWEGPELCRVDLNEYLSTAKRGLTQLTGMILT